MMIIICILLFLILLAVMDNQPTADVPVKETEEEVLARVTAQWKEKEEQEAAHKLKLEEIRREKIQDLREPWPVPRYGDDMESCWAEKPKPYSLPPLDYVPYHSSPPKSE